MPTACPTNGWSQHKKKCSKLERVLFICVLGMPVSLILLLVFLLTISSPFVRAWLKLERFEDLLESGEWGHDEGASASGASKTKRLLQENYTGHTLPHTPGGLTFVSYTGSSWDSGADTAGTESYVVELLTNLSIAMAYLVGALLFGGLVVSHALGGWMYHLLDIIIPIVIQQYSDRTGIYYRLTVIE